MFDKQTSEDHPKCPIIDEAEEIDTEVLEATAEFADYIYTESYRRAVESSPLYKGESNG